MVVSDQHYSQRPAKKNERASSVIVAIMSVLRGLPFLIRRRPRTPLRVMCIMAFDMLHTLRTKRRLPPDRVSCLALFLDFGAAANAVIDGKVFCENEFLRTRQLPNDAGIRSIIDDYWTQIQELEGQRPAAFGDGRQCRKVQLYRENVVRLSLGALSTAAFGYANVKDGVSAVSTDSDLKILFGIVMQFQIIDDVMDFAKDSNQRLPGFLTASASLRESFELTHHAACSYASSQGFWENGNLFPLRIALFAVSAITHLLIAASLAAGHYWGPRQQPL